MTVSTTQCPTHSGGETAAAYAHLTRIFSALATSSDAPPSVSHLREAIKESITPITSSHGTKHLSVAVIASALSSIPLGAMRAEAADALVRALWEGEDSSVFAATGLLGDYTAQAATMGAICAMLFSRVNAEDRHIIFTRMWDVAFGVLNEHDPYGSCRDCKKFASHLLPAYATYCVLPPRECVAELFKVMEAAGITQTLTYDRLTIGKVLSAVMTQAKQDAGKVFMDANTFWGNTFWGQAYDTHLSIWIRIQILPSALRSSTPSTNEHTDINGIMPFLFADRRGRPYHKVLWPHLIAISDALETRASPTELTTLLVRLLCVSASHREWWWLDGQELARFLTGVLPLSRISAPVSGGDDLDNSRNLALLTEDEWYWVIRTLLLTDAWFRERHYSDDADGVINAEISNVVETVQSIGDLFSSNSQAFIRAYNKAKSDVETMSQDGRIPPVCGRWA